MRHAIKPLLGALLALTALTALTSTAASAATCQRGGEREAEHKTLCIEGKQVGSTEKKVTTEATFTQKTGTPAVISVPTQNWSVTCAKVGSSEGSLIHSGGSGSVELEDLQLSLKECKVLIGGKEAPECKATAGTRSLLGSLANPESIELTNSAGAFGELDITGCTLNADYPINGTQACSLKQPEVEAITKELICEPKNSHLNFGEGYGGPPTLKLEGNLELTGASKGKKYSITK